jgi:5-bromo-4-chloroindolyl phosphate hydrolysis protein
LDADIFTALSALLGTLVGGLVTLAANRQQFKHQIGALREQYKTEFMAEETARHFLRHKGYTDRTFQVLKEHLGGFEDDELRKILVRAGAVRVFREQEEWWYLLSRTDERIERLQNT